LIFEKSTEVNCAPEVVWVSLWFGSLASRYVALLNQIGVKTELISSNVHFDASEIHASVSKVLNLRTNRIRKLYTLYKLLKYLKSSSTQKIFVDMSMSIGILVTFIFMARLKNAALFIHDPIPHDKAHEYGWLNSKLKESLIKKCMILVTFSLESKEI